jgi:HAD superfamily hydrolase (TIGR01509 family)
LIKKSILKELCIIFDCDGVLVDSEFIASKTYAKGLFKSGFPLSHSQYIKLFTGTNKLYLFSKVQELANITLPENFFDLYNFNENINKISPLNIKTLNLLYRMKVRRCIASNNRSEKIQTFLKATHLYHFFENEHIFTTEKENLLPKPFPDLFLYAADKMSKKPTQCVVIEDSEFGIQAALRANMRVIGFLGGSHAKKEWYKKNISKYNIPIANNQYELINILKSLS